MNDLSHYNSETYKIIGACFEVYNDKGCGFLEPVYQECLEIEMDMQGILYVPQKKLHLEYKNRPLDKTYEPDFICFNEIIVEIKATTELTAQHRSQLLNYLHATGIEIGLLVNFGHHPKLQYERIVNSTHL